MLRFRCSGNADHAHKGIVARQQPIKDSPGAKVKDWFHKLVGEGGRSWRRVEQHREESPRPDEFISAPTVTPVSFGSGEGRQLDVSYTITYRYFHAPVGEGDIATTWAQMVVNTFKIFDAVLQNDALSGLIDLNLSSVSTFGTVVDGSNNVYHGCDISFRVLEHV